MTVLTNVHVNRRAWRGYDEPGLPVGIYIAQGLVTGDATGGDMRLLFGFKEEGDAASGRFYNLEQVDLHTSNTSAANMDMRAENFDFVGAAGLINRQWAARTRNTGIVTALSTDTQFPLPLFLGLAAPVASLVSQIIIQTPNVDGVAFHATIQGFIWEPRSILAEGGLRRPLDSIFGNGRQ